MPISVDDGLSLQAEAALDKATTAKRRPGAYLLQAMLAGAYIGVAVVLMLMVGGTFITSDSIATKLVEGAVFGIALTLVVFAGAELFTGVVMTMTVGVMRGKAKVLDLIAVWAAALAGNFVGAAIFSAIVAGSGIVTALNPKHEATYLLALTAIIKGKVALSGAALFWRAVLCNFLVCLGLWMAQRATSDAAKLICLFWVLLAFVASGFEHSVANMTVFMLGIFTHAHLATAGNMLRNLGFTVPGNIVGGAVMVGAAYCVSSLRTAKEAAFEPPTHAPVGELADVAG